MGNKISREDLKNVVYYEICDGTNGKIIKASLAKRNGSGITLETITIPYSYETEELILTNMWQINTIVSNGQVDFSNGYSFNVKDEQKKLLSWVYRRQYEFKKGKELLAGGKAVYYRISLCFNAQVGFFGNSDSWRDNYFRDIIGGFVEERYINNWFKWKTRNVWSYFDAPILGYLANPLEVRELFTKQIITKNEESAYFPGLSYKSLERIEETELLKEIKKFSEQDIQRYINALEKTKQESINLYYKDIEAKKQIASEKKYAEDNVGAMVRALQNKYSK